MNWEYVVEFSLSELSAKELDKIGEGGWELVTITHKNNFIGDSYRYYFKRPKK